MLCKCIQSMFSQLSVCPQLPERLDEKRQLSLNAVRNIVCEMKQQSIFRNAAIVGALTGGSRVLGFVREVLMAYFFGTSLLKSAFDVAFRIPNLFRRLFGEGALSAALVPVYTATMERRGMTEANRLGSRVMSLLAAFLSFVSVLIILVAFLVPLIFSPGEKTVAVLSLLRIMMPYMVLICLVAFCMAILNSHGKFAVPAATPVILNVVWIIVLLFVCPFLDDAETRIHAVGWGVVIAGILQLAVQLPAMCRSGVFLRWELSWNDCAVREVAVLMAPVALGMGVLQFNVVIDGILALWVAEWAPAALTYAERLIYLPLGIFATALGTVLLPAFSRNVTQGRPEVMHVTLNASLRALLVIMTPAAVGLVVLAEPIVNTVFVWRNGAFYGDSVWQTVRALRFYAPGLVVFSLYKVIVPAFYAMKDTRTPLRIGIMAVSMNFIMNIGFIFTWPEGFKHAGLAAATVLSSLFNGVALAFIYNRRMGSPGWQKVFNTACRTLLASAITGGVAVMVFSAVSSVFGYHKTGELVALICAITSGVIIYFMLALLFFRADLNVLLKRKKQLSD